MSAHNVVDLAKPEDDAALARRLAQEQDEADAKKRERVRCYLSKWRTVTLVYRSKLT